MRQARLNKPSRFPELAHSHYGCYFYGEGRYYYQHEKLDHFTGHPVLYVPGSGGQPISLLLDLFVKTIYFQAATNKRETLAQSCTRK